MKRTSVILLLLTFGMILHILYRMYAGYESIAWESDIGLEGWNISSYFFMGDESEWQVYMEEGNIINGTWTPKFLV